MVNQAVSITRNKKRKTPILLLKKKIDPPLIFKKNFLEGYVYQRKDTTGDFQLTMSEVVIMSSFIHE